MDIENHEATARLNAGERTSTADPFAGLPRGHYGAILADPPWRFEVWSGATAVQKRGSKTTYKAAQVHYETMSFDELCALPVEQFAAKDSALFMWVTWPTLRDGIRMMEAW